MRRCRRGWDHPRSRGVYTRLTPINPQQGGSSPLARGLPGEYRLRRARLRIIPARAGFTRRRSRPACGSWDHPRSRGVYGRVRDPHGAPAGSSPLARGLRGSVSWTTAQQGIIPARAGFTNSRTFRRPGRQDHPRSRGVYASAAASSAVPPGSSPLARGLPVDDADSAGEPGIIPARAGFTASASTAPSGPPDHPRSRGVYLTRGAASRWFRGSSPLARGLLPVRGLDDGEHGIIPARAGFTSSGTRSTASSEDHPRSRGVYDQTDEETRLKNGSSPLARGLLDLGVQRGQAARIIPARAGFTGGCGGGGRAGRDHPRSRGVYRRRAG